MLKKQIPNPVIGRLRDQFEVLNMELWAKIGAVSTTSYTATDDMLADAVTVGDIARSMQALRKAIGYLPSMVDAPALPEQSAEEAHARPIMAAMRDAMKDQPF